MKIRQGFVVREIAGSIVVVPTGDLVNEFKCMMNLNSTGKVIWDLLQNDISQEEIVQKLMEKYKVTQDRATQCAQGFIEQLKAVKIIEQE